MQAHNASKEIRADTKFLAEHDLLRPVWSRLVF
jgi:hypothetical protein